MKRVYIPPEIQVIAMQYGGLLATSGGGGSLPPGIDAEPFGARENSFDDDWLLEDF